MSSSEGQKRFHLGVKGALLIVLPNLFFITFLFVAIDYLISDNQSILICIFPLLMIFVCSYFIFDAFSVCLEISEDYVMMSYWGQCQSMKYSEIEALSLSRQLRYDAVEVSNYSGTEILIPSIYFDQFWGIIKLLINNVSQKKLPYIDPHILQEIQS